MWTSLRTITPARKRFKRTNRLEKYDVVMLHVLKSDDDDVSIFATSIDEIVFYMHNENP